MPLESIEIFLNTKIMEPVSGVEKVSGKKHRLVQMWHLLYLPVLAWHNFFQKSTF